MTRKEIAALRMKAASEHVENAQHELERAISALGALAWMSSEQTKLGVLRDRIHEAFYRLSANSHARAKACAKAELDREPEPGDEDPHRGCCDALTRAAFARAARTQKTALVCDAGCEGTSFVARELIDVTTSGHTDIVCGKCSGPMVVLS